MFKIDMLDTLIETAVSKKIKKIKLKNKQEQNTKQFILNMVEEIFHISKKIDNKISIQKLLKLILSKQSQYVSKKLKTLSVAPKTKALFLVPKIKIIFFLAPKVSTVFFDYIENNINNIGKPFPKILPDPESMLEKKNLETQPKFIDLTSPSKKGKKRFEK